MVPVVLSGSFIRVVEINYWLATPLSGVYGLSHDQLVGNCISDDAYSVLGFSAQGTPGNKQQAVRVS